MPIKTHISTWRWARKRNGAMAMDFETQTTGDDDNNKQNEGTNENNFRINDKSEVWNFMIK